MIRAVAIASLVSLLALVLYLPSARPASAFIATVRSEHTVLTDFWGRQHALQMLERMLSWQPETMPTPPLVPVGKPAATANGNVNQEVAALGNRLLNNDYFRSLNGLFVLATYRMAVLFGLLPGAVPFVLAGVVDGFVRRAVKGKEFRGHNPEVFSACACGAILVACSLVVLCTLPAQLPPWLLPSLLLAMGGLTSLGIANYHKRV